MRSIFQRFDLRITVTYTLVAALWVVMSDRLIDNLMGDVSPTDTVIDIVRELGFVAVTAIALFVILSRELHRRSQVEQAQKAEISAREDSEKALREIDQQMRMFVEHAPAAIAMLDTEMRYLLVSQRWLTDYRLTEPNVIGRTH